MRALIVAADCDVKAWKMESCPLSAAEKILGAEPGPWGVPRAKRQEGSDIIPRLSF